MYFCNSMNEWLEVRKRRILNSELCGKLGRGAKHLHIHMNIYSYKDEKKQKGRR